MDSLLRDLRYALRGLRRAPVFTAVAVVTLALGIGVNSTIFSLVNAVLFRPLAVAQPGELVNVYGRTATSATHDALSYANYRDYRAQSQTLSGLVAFSNFFASLSIEGSAGLVVGEIVSDNYFDVLGVAPTLGRPFLAEEYAAPGAGPVAVLSHAFWHGRFAGDRAVLGRTLQLNGTVYTVVGVAPEGFGGMFPAVASQLWIPLSMVDDVEPLGNHRNTGGGGGPSLLDQRGRHFLWAKGRMRPGVGVEQVRAELDGIAARLALQHPEANERERLSVVPTNDVGFHPDIDGTVGPAGLVLLVAAGLVLLVACANLANMMLARAAGRRRELAVRLAIGASRGQLVRLLLTESVLVALAGGAAAVVLAGWLTGLLARIQPPLPIEVGLLIEPDWRVLLFTLVAALVTGVTFGLVPALRASRPELVPALKDTGERSGGRRRVELRDALVVTQVAFSLLLLVLGAMMARSLGVAARVDLGYDSDRTAHLGMSLEMNGYGPDDGRVLVETGRLRLAALPHVEAVGLASRIPLELNHNGFGLFIDGHQGPDPDRPIIMNGASVDEGYFDALALRIVAGRGIEPADRDERRRVAVITQAMATRFWPDGDAVGREFRTSAAGAPFRIVGVVENYKVDTPGERPKSYIHIPLPREALSATYLVRTATPAGEHVAGLEAELRRLDPDLVFLGTGTLREVADVRIFPIRAGAWLIGAFGVLALLVAAVGLYGVIAFSVSRRFREIGIRKALGAEPGTVVTMVLRQGMILVAVGGAAGAVMAAAGATALSSVLYVGRFDLLSFALAFAVLAAVAALANWLPAWRAAAVDPMRVLRGE